MASFLARQERFDVVGSTNDVVRGWLAEGTPEVCLASAEEQTSGRGREGRACAGQGDRSGCRGSGGACPPGRTSPTTQPFLPSYPGSSRTLGRTPPVTTHGVSPVVPAPTIELMAKPHTEATFICTPAGPR